MPFLRLPFLFFCFVLGSAGWEQASAQAQPEPDSSAIIRSDDGTTTIYPASYFAPYNPLSLQDMLQRIPGASISQSVAEEERRGLRGNEDAVLINGQQVTGKDSGGASALNRIAASQVERIELIRGSTSEVQTTSQRIINVILKEDAGDTFVFTLAMPTYLHDGSVRPTVNTTYGVTAIDRNWSIGFVTNPRYRPWRRSKETIDLDGLPIERGIETEQRDFTSMNANGRYEQTFDGGARLQVNGLVQWANNDRERREVLFDPALPTGLDRFSDVLEDERRDTYSAELTADYSFPLGARSTFTILGLYHWEEVNKQRDVFDILPLDEPQLAREERLDTLTESIVRGTLDHNFTDRLAFQLGLEGTINTQKTDFDLQTLQNGTLQPLPIFNSDGKVTEYRGEGFSTLRWRMRDTVETEIGLAVEASQIKQNSGDVNSSRSLVYAKPTVSVYWDVTPRNKAFFTLVRDVDQLDFGQFVANITQTEQELEAGNPDLNPVRSWDYELGLEHRLADGVGVISGALFYRDVQDVRGRLRASPNSVVSLIGNIGGGEEYGIDSEVSLDFSRLDWWDGVLKVNYLRRHTSVIDPFDNVKRPFGFTPNWESSAEYRHELRTFIDGYIGFNYSQTGARFINDIDKRDRLKTQASLTITIEHRITDNFRINISSNNFLNQRETRRREFFTFAPDGQRLVTANRVQDAKWGRIINAFIRVNL